MKNINKLLILLCVIFSFSFVSCIYGTNNFLYKGNQVDNRVDYIHELSDFQDKITNNENKDVDKYKILVITDTHFGSPHKKTETEEFYKWLNKLNKDDIPRFCLILGDNVDQGLESEYKIFTDFIKHIEDKNIPVLSIVGNHDLFNSGWDNFVKNCYPHCSLFHFNTKEYSWYGIDTGTGNIGQKQYNLLKQEFKKDKKEKIIICHYPLTNAKWLGAISFHDSTERNLLVDLYGQTNVKAVLCGHLHKIDFADLGAFKEFGHPSFCYSTEPIWTLYQVDESNEGSPTITQLPRNF